MAAVAVLAGAGLALLNAVSESDSSFTVTQGSFTLSCPQNTLAEGATLTCTLANTSGEAKPWPVVAIMHLSTDTDRALVVGSQIDVDFGTRSPAADLDNGAWWIGSTLVGYSRFDWTGRATADPTATTTTTVAGATTTTEAGATTTTTTTVAGATTTTTVAAQPGHTRTVSIRATDDSRKESREKFYVALGPDASRGVGILFNNKHAVTVTDNDSASSDKSLSSFKATAGGSDTVLTTTAGSQTITVGYQVTEATLTAEVAHDRATMSMTATHGGNSVAVGAGGAASVDVISGQQSAAVPLAVGTTVVTLTVTAEDGTTASYVVSIQRSALAADTTTVTVSADGFTLSCPAKVVEGDDVTCTLTNTNSSSAPWPVVAVLHSSADSRRALVSEDPIIPDTDPAYGKDVSLGTQQPAREAFNFGYGELFSGGSLSVYRTYGYEKFDWAGSASGGASREVDIELHEATAANDLADSPETFYVALAPSGYSGLSQLVDNMAPILLRQKASVTSLTVGSITQTTATVTVSVTDVDGSTLYLRHRTGSDPWTEASKESAATMVFALTGLSDGTAYEVDASFESDFASGVTSQSFTTVPKPSVSSVSVGSIGQTTATVTVAVADADTSTLYLRYRTGSDSWLSASAASAASTAFTLSGLQAGTTYEVEASFESGFASGVTSESFTTEPPDPSVSSVSVGSIGQTSASVSVSVADVNGSTLYLRYRTGTNSWTSASKTSTATTVFDLADLSAGTSYEVQVSFESGFGSGTASESFTTEPPDPSVSSVSVGSIGQTSASVSVSVADVNGSTLYLRYRTGTDSWASTSKVSTSTTVFSLTSLQAGSAYEVQVSFESGFGSVSSKSFTTVAPDASVSSVTVGSIGQTSASVSAVVADVDGSTLYLRYRTGTDSWTEASQAATATTVFSLTGLQAGTAYQVQVSFEDDFGSGVTSASFTTEPPDPSVSSVSVGSIGQTSAQVTVVVANANSSTLYLRHRMGTDSWTATSTASAASTVFSLTGLRAGTTYQVEVSFVSGFGSGVTSASFTTEPPDPSVSSVSVGSISQTSARVTVVVANVDGSALYLRYRTGSGNWTAVSKASSASTVFNLADLSAEAAYSVEVSFVSGFGSGVASASFTTVSNPSVSSVSVDSISQTSARVSAVVANANGSTLYLRYRAGSGAWTEESMVSSATTVFDLADLSAGTTYSVEVSFDSVFGSEVESASFATLVLESSGGPAGQSQVTSDTQRVVDPRGPGPGSGGSGPGGAGPGGSGPGGSGPGAGEQEDEPASGMFADVDSSSVHEASVDALYAAGVTVGCGRQPMRFCPDEPVTRAQMAMFLVRALDLDPGPPRAVGFADVDSSSVHRDSVGALYAAGITVGCGRNPARFCPDEPVTRAQMAVFLVRALGLDPDRVRAVGFADVDSSSMHRSSIDALYAAGITGGCGRRPLRFCPDEPVTRAQMATFLVRALEL